MQVKFDTYHGGIQWNSVVIQVKKATLREWEVAERVELKIDGMCQVDNLHHRKNHISMVSTSRTVSG
jgi:hypothetical protein